MSMARAIDGVGVKHSLKACTERHGLGAKGSEVLNAIGKQLRDFLPDELNRYGEYCLNDVEITHELFSHYIKYFSYQELAVVNLTIKMFTDPILELDIPLLEQHLANIKLEKEKLMQIANTNSELLQSNPKFAECLKTLGVVPPIKISPRTNKETFAFLKVTKL